MKKLAITLLSCMMLLSFMPQRTSADGGLTLGIIGTVLGGAALGGTMLHSLNHRRHNDYPQAYYPVAGGFSDYGRGCGGGCPQTFRQNCGGSRPSCGQAAPVYPRAEAIVPVYQTVQPIMMPYPVYYPVQQQVQQQVQYRPAPQQAPVVVQFQMAQPQPVAMQAAPTRRVSVVEERIPVRGNW